MIPTDEYKTFSDAELIDSLKESDHAAFTEIYRRYNYLLIIHAFKKLQDEEQAKDIVQELFTNLWLKRESETMPDNLAAYLYTAIRNRVFNLFTHQQVKSKYIDSILLYSANYIDDTSDHRIRAQELTGYIEQEINALPPKMRRIFQMSRQQYLSHQEIADQLNTSTGNVSQQVNDALRVLKVKLSTFLTYFL